MDNSSIIIIAVLTIIVIAILLLCFFWYIKKKIRNKVIDKGADLVTKASEKYLDEKIASKVNLATNVTAETLKNGIISTVTKQGLDRMNKK